jgi:hypothetical protein
MSEDLQAKKRAQDDLNDIDALKRSEPFTRFFIRRVNEELRKAQDTILTDRTLTPEQLHEERLRYFAYSDTSRLMEREEAACRSILGPPKD